MFSTPFLPRCQQEDYCYVSSSNHAISYHPPSPSWVSTRFFNGADWVLFAEERVKGFRALEQHGGSPKAASIMFDYVSFSSGYARTCGCDDQCYLALNVISVEGSSLHARFLSVVDSRPYLQQKHPSHMPVGFYFRVLDRFLSRCGGQHCSRQLFLLGRSPAIQVGARKRAGCIFYVTPT